MSKEIKYSREFKLDALNLLQKGKSLSEISRGLGISVNTLCTWRKRYKLYGDKAFQGPGIHLPKNEHQEELRRLKKENAELKMERDILKKSAKHLLQERSVRYEFIHKYMDIFPIEKMCKILKVSRSSYFTG